MQEVKTIQNLADSFHLTYYSSGKIRARHVQWSVQGLKVGLPTENFPVDPITNETDLLQETPKQNIMQRGINFAFKAQTLRFVHCCLIFKNLILNGI